MPTAAKAGLFIYQRLKASHLAYELFELRNSISIGVIGDVLDIKLPTGYACR
jgi:hypothetical protein